MGWQRCSMHVLVVEYEVQAQAAVVVRLVSMEAKSQRVTFFEH